MNLITVLNNNSFQFNLPDFQGGINDIFIASRDQIAIAQIPNEEGGQIIISIGINEYEITQGDADKFYASNIDTLFTQLKKVLGV